MAAVYPGAAASDANLYIAVANLSTTLNGSIDNSVTSVVLTSATGFPTAGFIVVDSETIKYTGVSTNTLTGCTRGADSTTAASHANAAAVYHAVVASHHNALKDEVIAVETDLVAALAQVPGATTVNTALQNIVTAYTTGWSVASGTAWTYASSSTVNVPSGAASIYQVNDKIKITQTTAKYFYVTAVADTLLTLSGGGTYTVANASITAQWYSRVRNPKGWLETEFVSHVVNSGGNGNGTGSYANIRRYLNTRVATGTAITVADSTGTSFTVNETGEYEVSVTDHSSSGINIGIVVNSATQNTAVYNLTYAQGFRGGAAGGVNVLVSFTRVLYLTAGDIVKCQNDAPATMAGDVSYVSFSIRKTSACGL